MYKNFILIITLFLAVLSSSCDKWLSQEPEDGIISNNFWQTKEDLQSAMFGCYSALEKPAVAQTFFLWGELRADMLSASTSTPVAYSNILNGNILTDNTVCQWSSLYSVINSCNLVLYYAPIVKNLDASLTDEQMKQYMAEALGLRSLMYFYLVRTFDQVPLITAPTLNDNNTFQMAKSERSVILKKLINDLDTAINTYQAPESYGNDAYDKGRFTKYSLLALQADVYLWAEQYQNCANACQKIMTSGKYAIEGRDTLNPYPTWLNDVFVQGNCYSESIFELQTTSDVITSLSSASPWYTMFSRNQLVISDNIVNLFPTPQIEPDNYLPDIRSNYGSYNYSSGKVWKYIASSSGVSKEKTSTDYSHWIFYRYADVMLMCAEAYAQMGPAYFSKASAIVKEIRYKRRADSETEQTPSSVNDWTKYILAERSRELAYEGKRWFDILRNAKRNKYANKQILLDVVASVAPASQLQSLLAKAQDTLSHYLPIYYSELESNKLLKQNSFYSK